MEPIRSRSEIRFIRFGPAAAEERALRLAAERGEFVRIRVGAYLAADRWAALTGSERQRLAIAAVQDARRSGFVASHRSAAALWQIPQIRMPDTIVHQRVRAGTHARTSAGIQRHPVDDEDLHLVAIHGIPCTSLERTIVDIALGESFEESVVAIDWALREHTDAAALLRTLDEVAPVRGRRRAEAAIAFGDAASGSVGESRSRVQIAAAGLPAPRLQTAFVDAAGFIGRTDFDWPDVPLIGEFDGKAKYADPRMLAGRTPADVLFAEKVREDRLRALGPRFARWTWRTLETPGALAERLRAAGLR